MKLTAPIVLALCLTVSLPLAAQQAATPSQAQPFTDLANLGGESITPLNGHELPIDQGASGLAQLLRKLNTRASILNIVAHPDDEDGGMLTLYSRGLGARVADLSLTRGEGGQNFVTGDFEDALGLIRTQELLSNDRYTGVTQMFGTEVDFGFSKTREESFARWTHDRVLYDAVRAIRIYRPLVITATFIGNVTDGHGQHQVSGEIAQEAFKAAANPNVFPAMIREGILPWQALKVYARVPFAEINSKGVFDYATGQYVPARFTNYVTGQVTTSKPTANVEVPEGTTDPLLTAASASCENSVTSTEATHNPVISTEAQHSGETCSLNLPPNSHLSYLQFARIGLGLQRTQISRNMRLPVSGMHNSGYTLYGSVLCNAPANARVPSITPRTCYPDQAQRAEGKQVPRGFSLGSHGPSPEPGFSPQGMPSPSTHGPAPTARLVTAASTAPMALPSNKQVPRGFSLGSHGPSPEPGFSPQGMPSPSTHGPAPTARLVTAHGEALGTPSSESTRAESPIQNPNLEAQSNFFTGIDTSIEGIATLAPSAPPFLRTQLARMAAQIAAATRDFNPSNPSAIAPAMAIALNTCDALIGLVSSTSIEPLQKANVLHELRIKRVQLNDALVLALGIHLDATVPGAQRNIIAGSAPPVHVTVSADAPAQLVYVHTVVFDDQHQAASKPARSRLLVQYRGEPFPATGTLAKDIPLDSIGTEDITRPYFFRKSIEQPTYELTKPNLRNAPGSPPALAAATYIDFKGLGSHAGPTLTVSRIVHDGPQPVSIIPPVSIASAPSATVLPNGQTTAQLTATLSTDATTSANINVQSPHNWSIQAKTSPAPATGPTHSIDFFLHPTTPPTGPAIFHLTATTPNHHAYTEGWRPVGYPGLILTNYYTPATTRVVPVDLKLPAHLRIAYLPGTGDAVPEALASIGLNPTLITVSDLTPSKLANFDTIILGVRTYSAHPDLHGAPTKALLDFARNGGNVLVQYQTSDFTSADAPYPLDLGSGAKVVVETDPVELLNPATNRYPEASASGLIGSDRYPEASASGLIGSDRYPEASASGLIGSDRYPEASASGLIGSEGKGVLTPGYALLNVPNKITSADFNNWIEERGHGFLENWDPHYTALTETHDPGGDGTIPQPPQHGGLITAHVGRGRWTYVAFALYRQLPEAVPGAYRLFVNLIAPPSR